MDRLRNLFDSYKSKREKGITFEAEAEAEIKGTLDSAYNFQSNVSNTTSSKRRLANLAQIGEDWLYLALLGTIMALLSFSMDLVISLFLDTRLWMFQDLDENNILIQYLGWCLTPVVLVMFSTGFVHLCSPTAIGSGIPEMKTILRGVVLNEYLTFRTLVAKVVGLTFTLGSGLPLGKEGPSVHMASIVATLLSKLVASFKGIYENESRTSEMLSAACAVGVAATFYAPIGGVLFSIEVTTVYFAVRSYWRGFFAACCGATIWRLLGFWVKKDESISALFKTNFHDDFPFDPLELLVFSFIGASCGLAGAAYIKFHREIVQFFRRHKRISVFLQRNRFVYPILVTLTITTVTFPPILGKYTAANLNTHTTIEHLFSNRTWSLGSQDIVSKNILDSWTTSDTSFHFHLIMYVVMLFWTSALASTIPIPSGIFIPVLKMGAAYGRLLGELMHSLFPEGIKYGDYAHPAAITPGSYAVVGAAALSGSVTHTISTSVILFEMTGQIVHIIPVILGVLIANAVCQSLQPSIYDSIIEIKKLPYLPPIASSNSVSHKIVVKDFMRDTNLAYVWKEKCTYADVKALLTAHKKIISFPLVESPQSMKLLGSIPRPDLLKLLYLHLGKERRLQEISRRDSVTKMQPIVQQLSAKSLAEETAVTINLTGDLNVPERSMRESLASKCGSFDTDQPCSSFVGEQYRLVNEQNKRDLIPDGSDDGNSNQQSELLNQNKRPSPETNLTEQKPKSEEIDQGSSLDKTNVAPRKTSIIPAVTENSRQSKAESLLKSTQVKSRPLTPLEELKSTSSFNFAPHNPPLNSKPTKSILKTSSTFSGSSSIYKRNISSQSFAGTFGILGGGSGQEGQARLNDTNKDQSHTGKEGGFTLGDGCSSIELTTARTRKVRLPRLRVVDMTAEEQEQWEKEQLDLHVDLSSCQIDEAPFQLVEQTSLYRVHTLFSMLGLNHAYVTSFGQLVGVVALKDIRLAIEKMLQEK